MVNLLKDSKVLLALETVLESPTFSGQERAKQLLQHLVERKLAGDERALKGYAIGLDVFDKPPDFDPGGDPIVRVQMGRLRQLLEKYYLSEGAEASLRINLQVGTYVPRFEEASQVANVSASTAAPTTRKLRLPFSNRPTILRTRTQIISALIVALIAGFGLAAYFFGHSNDPDGSANVASDDVSAPIVEVIAFKDLTGTQMGRFLSRGIQHQLVADLSRFRNLRVRDAQQSASDGSDAARVMSNYRLSASLLQARATLQFTLTLVEAQNDEIIWGETVRVNATDEGMQTLLINSVQEIVARVGGISGPVQTRAMQQLQHRHDKYQGSDTSDYSCVMLYYSYDRTKNANERKRATECLQALVDNNSTNSNVWAAHGFLKFLDWTSKASEGSGQLAEEATRAANKAIQLDPTDPAGHEVLGSVKLALGDHEAARRSYARALDLNPSNPDLHVTVGWQKILSGEWDDGLIEVNHGISLSLAPPGWFYIPVAIDAFRQEDYERSLKVAQTIMESGDKRGIVLALAAAAMIPNDDLMAKYRAEFLALKDAIASDPMREIRNVFNMPEILESYARALALAKLDEAGS